MNLNEQRSSSGPVESAMLGRDAGTTAEFFWTGGLCRYRVELDNPAAGWGNSNVLPQATFGTITSTRVNIRRIQFALKYNF